MMILFFTVIHVYVVSNSWTMAMCESGNENEMNRALGHLCAHIG